MGGHPILLIIAHGKTTERLGIRYGRPKAEADAGRVRPSRPRLPLEELLEYLVNHLGGPVNHGDFSQDGLA